MKECENVLVSLEQQSWAFALNDRFVKDLEELEFLLVGRSISFQSPRVSKLLAMIGNF
jgi:hypothetical protein